jgi:hypothetical protein
MPFRLPRATPARLLASLVVMLSMSCAQVVRRVLTWHEKITEKVGPDHVIVRFSREFLTANRESITLEADFTVDVAARMINPAVFDGDIHIAGRSPGIGLRMVAEIKNAKTAPRAVALIRQAEASRRPIRIVAVPRYWPEHAIGLPHRQGEAMPRLPNSNPDHLFELHPIVQVEDQDLRHTLHPVQGYSPFHASTVFGQLARAELTFRLRGDSVLIETEAGLWNDVHFLLELTDRPVTVRKDGRYLSGRARDLEGNLLRDSVRIALVGGSPPDSVIRGLPAGAWIHVWGLPRIGLDGLVRLMESVGDTVSHRASLPFEMVILGVYPKGQ